MTTSNRSPYALIYSRGPSWVEGKAVYQHDLMAHAQYHQSLLDSGTLLFAGPFSDSTGGLAMALAASAEDAQRLIDADPAVAAGVMRAQAHPMHFVFNKYVGKHLMNDVPGF